MKSVIAVLIILMFKCPLVDQPKAQDFSGWWIYGESLHLFKDEKSLKEFEFWTGMRNLNSSLTYK